MIKKLEEKIQIQYVKWDGSDETLNLIKKELVILCKNTKVGRCYNSVSDDNDLPEMFISYGKGNFKTTSFVYVGNYVVLDYTKERCSKPEYYLFNVSEERFLEIYGFMGKLVDPLA